MDTWTFEDLRSWVASFVQKSSLRRSTATPAERLSCADWIILSLLKHQETIDHKFFSLIGILIVRVAAKFLLLFNSCCCWWWLNLWLPLRKLLLTSIRLIKLSLKKKISYDIVRKLRTSFTWRLVVKNHVEKSCSYENKTWLAIFSLRNPSRKLKILNFFFWPTFSALFSDIAQSCINCKCTRKKSWQNFQSARNF